MSVKVVLVGFSASGKTTVGRKLAALTGWKLVDVDALVEKSEGRPIKEIIRVDGEERFRTLESDALKRAFDSDAGIVATGGGILLRDANRQQIEKASNVVHLGVEAEVAASRLAQDDQAVRPLLSQDDLLSSVVTLMSKRSNLYGGFPLKVWTDWADADRIAEAVLAELSLTSKLKERTVIPSLAANKSSKIVIGVDAIASLGERIKDVAPNATQAAIIVDRQVWQHHAERLTTALASSDLKPLLIELEPGEATKALSTVERAAEALLAADFTRSDLIIALGGGVVGDAAGLVASLYMRGVPLIQVPTTIVAQADAAIGGKTAVNLRSESASGKNILGTFYPADLIISDISLLRSLPDRAYREGLAEVIKYGAIHSKDFLLWLEQHVEQIIARDELLLRDIVEFSSKAKLRFVVGDVEDRTGVRAHLNFGHTLGHAIERLQGYQGYLHGEAVAVGMVFALRFGEHLGKTDKGLSVQLGNLLSRIGLPTEIPTELLEGVEAAKKSGFQQRWEEALKVDKKRKAGLIDFVFVRSAGAATTSPTAVTDIVAFLAEQTMQEDE
ncbi:MAG: 3-dehydroquinate synthase [Bdellovibrionales bacterium]|nr:3-dehydroquinate synthase [Bdellovibrionales bacterium]